jgi:hypothetical protein
MPLALVRCSQLASHYEKLQNFAELGLEERANVIECLLNLGKYSQAIS